MDTQFLNWARVSLPAPNPESKVEEHGKLIPRGFGIYALEGRREGLTSFGVNLVGIGQTIKVYMRANVPVKDFTMPAPIRQILYEVMPSDPAQIEQSIKEIADGGNLDPDSNSGGDSPIGVGSEETNQTGSGEVGTGAPDGGSLGGVAS